MTCPILKRYFTNRSLSSKLRSISLIPTCAASLLVIAVALGFQLKSSLDEVRHHSEILARVLAHNTASALMFEDGKAAKTMIDALSRNPDVAAADLVLADGRLLASYRRPGSGDARLAAAGETSARDASNAIHTRFSTSHIDTFAPIALDGTRFGHLVIRVDLIRTYHRIGNWTAIVLVAATCAFALVAWMLSCMLSSIIDPIRQLVNTMRSIWKKGDYSQRASVQTNDEIGELARNFNFMIEQIQMRDNALGIELMERKRAEIQLERTAHFDSVTGLPNRHSFNRRMKEMCRISEERGEAFALMFIDLDKFKYVNDTFGHAAGDELLVNVARRLQGSLRAGDFVARLGGDEFAILLEKPKDLGSVILLADKLLETVKEPYICDLAARKELNIGASIGVAMMPDHARDFEGLFICADTAMYEAKAGGRGFVCVWNPELSQRTSERFMIDSGLRVAIERGELEMHYQPIVDMESGRIAGAEALLRWRHPTIGYVMPSKLIPIAEESQLILTIGYWAMRESCRQIRIWNERFGMQYVSVNVSGKQFRDPEFVRHLEKIVSEEGIAPSMIELEVTETVLMTQTPEMLAMLTGLAGRGFRFSLDDFGTGYSSLAYLKQLSLCKLKIDRRFVSDLPCDRNDAAIVQAIVSLAHHLELGIVAEGIETEEQSMFLQQLDCVYGQGEYFSRPLNADEFEVFISENAKKRSGSAFSNTSSAAVSTPVPAHPDNALSVVDDRV